MAPSRDKVSLEERYNYIDSQVSEIHPVMKKLREVCPPPPPLQCFVLFIKIGYDIEVRYELFCVKV